MPHKHTDSTLIYWFINCKTLDQESVGLSVKNTVFSKCLPHLAFQGLNEKHFYFPKFIFFHLLIQILTFVAHASASKESIIIMPKQHWKTIKQQMLCPSQKWYNMVKWPCPCLSGCFFFFIFIILVHHTLCLYVCYYSAPLNVTGKLVKCLKQNRPSFFSMQQASC